MCIRDRYYNLLNVFGDRLRTNTSANVTLTGYAAGNMKNAQIMADNVKKYLVNNFDIAEYRITSRNIGAPLNYSNANTEDAELIKAESNRVEITTNPIDILKPAMLNSVQEEMLDNDVIVTIPENEDVAFWSIDAVSYTHLRAHETVLDLVCRLLLEKKKTHKTKNIKKTKKNISSI